MKFLDLFAGIGGFRLGMEQAGHECVGFCEIDKFARASYKAIHNTEGEREYHDITTVSNEEWRNLRGTVEIICGGFPCQAFSIAGKRKGFLDETRGTLFFEIARAAEQIKPRTLFLENVKGLLSSNTIIDYIDAVRIVNNDLKEHKELWETKRPLVLKQWKELDDNLTNILLKKFVSENIFQKEQLDTLSKKDLEFRLEQLGAKAEAGLMQNLQYCVTKISQTMKKYKNFQDVLMRVFDEQGEDIISSLNQLSSIESLRAMDISMLEKMVDMFVEIDLLLNNQLEESSEKTKLFTTLMDEKQTTNQKIYSFVTELPTLVYIIRQWKLLQRSWKKALLLLTEKKESTFYAKTFKIILSVLNELGYDCEWQVLNSKNFGVPQNRERVFIIGHLRGERGREVFPIAGIDTTPNNQCIKKVGNIRKNGKSQSGDVFDKNGLSPTLCSTTTMKDAPKIITGQPNRIDGKRQVSYKLSDTVGTLLASQYKNGDTQPKVVIPVLTPDRIEKRQNGRRFKEDGEEMFTLTAQDKHGVMIVGGLYTNVSEKFNRGVLPGLSRTLKSQIHDAEILIKEATAQGYTEASPGDSVNISHPNSKTRRGRVGKGIANTLLTGKEQAVVTEEFQIRKLTPRECWRLQGFPDWAFDRAKEVNSDSQLYKQAGNSVTVPVIYDIARRLK